MNAEHRNQLNLLIEAFAEKGVSPEYLDQLSALAEIIHASGFSAGVQAAQTTRPLRGKNDQA